MGAILQLAVDDDVTALCHTWRTSADTDFNDIMQTEDVFLLFCEALAAQRGHVGLRTTDYRLEVRWMI